MKQHSNIRKSSLPSVFQAVLVLALLIGISTAKNIGSAHLGEEKSRFGRGISVEYPGFLREETHLLNHNLLINGII